jgi:glyoxylase-like metal-dependent hydrolase (beta-lactamase superfamily II)
MSEPRRIAENVYAVRRRGVNAYLVLGKRELTLIDTGLPGGALAIADAIVRVGRRTDELRHIVLTHCHVDHAGSAASLTRMAPASVSMHAEDARLAREGRCLRPLQAGGGRGRLIRPLLATVPKRVEPVTVEHELADGDELPYGGGLRVVHTPGHTAGHVSLLAPEAGVVFAADAAANLFGVGPSPFNEDELLARDSLRRLAAAAKGYDVVCFGHGAPVEGAQLSA